MKETPKNIVKIAVVILNWNGKSYLEKFLPSIVQYSKSEQVKIYVADNGSNDESVSFVQKKYPEISNILLDQNYGFAGGYNKALAKIQAEYYVILNSDVEVTENWIFPIISKMDADGNVAAAMPKIKSHHNKEYFEYAGAAGGYIDKFGYPFCQGRILNKIEEDTDQYNIAGECFWASGACLFIRSDIFHIHDGFDEDFFAHMEEIDLCWRIKNSGFKIMFYPDSEVYHVGGGALPNDSPKKLFLNFRNSLLMLIKNLPQNKLALFIFVRMVLDGLAASVYLFKLQFSNFFAVFKAHISFYTLLNKFWVKRKKMTQKNHLHMKGVYNGSMIYAFFIQKIDTFKKLPLKN